MLTGDNEILKCRPHEIILLDVVLAFPKSRYSDPQKIV